MIMEGSPLSGQYWPRKPLPFSHSFTPGVAVSVEHSVIYWRAEVGQETPREVGVQLDELSTPVGGVGYFANEPVIAHSLDKAESRTQRQCGRYRSEEHTSELQSLMRISYAVFCLKKKKTTHQHKHQHNGHNVPLTRRHENT